MADSYIVQKDTLTAIADAVRAKTGGTVPLSLEVDVPEAINSLSYKQSVAVKVQNNKTSGTYTTIYATHRSTTTIAKGRTATIYVPTGGIIMLSGSSLTVTQPSGVKYLANSADRSYWLYEVTAQSGTQTIAVR